MKEIELKAEGKQVTLTFWHTDSPHRFGTTIALDARDVLELMRVLREGVK